MTSLAIPLALKAVDLYVTQEDRAVHSDGARIQVGISHETLRQQIGQRIASLPGPISFVISTIGTRVRNEHDRRRRLGLKGPILVAFVHSECARHASRPS